MSVEFLIVMMIILGKVGPLALCVASMCRAPARGRGRGRRLRRR
jgi:hypothetical protein